jgi:hypothetical protein
MIMEKELQVSKPQLGLIAVTRALIGVGAGLLLANQISPEKRKAIGWPLFVGGLATTIPIALHLFHGDGADTTSAAEKFDRVDETSH